MFSNEFSKTIIKVLYVTGYVGLMVKLVKESIVIIETCVQNNSNNIHLYIAVAFYLKNGKRQEAEAQH